MDDGFEQLREVLAANVRRLRKVRALSQEQLAFDAEVDRTYVSQLERRINNPSMLVLYRIARVLGTTVPALLTTHRRSGADAA